MIFSILVKMLENKMQTFESDNYDYQSVKLSLRNEKSFSEFVIERTNFNLIKWTLRRFIAIVFVFLVVILYCQVK